MPSAIVSPAKAVFISLLSVFSFLFYLFVYFWFCSGTTKRLVWGYLIDSNIVRNVAPFTNLFVLVSRVKPGF